MNLELTDPPVLYFDDNGVYVVNDFGDAVRVPSAMYYAPHLFPSLN